MNPADVLWNTVLPGLGLALLLGAPLLPAFAIAAIVTAAIVVVLRPQLVRRA